MKKILELTFFSLLSLASWETGQGNALNTGQAAVERGFGQKGPERLVGRVLDKKNEPIIGVRVFLFDGAYWNGVGKTGTNGSYSFPVPERDSGTFWVGFVAPGFAVKTVQVYWGDGPAIPDVSMDKEKVIEGHFYYRDGRPLRNADVWLYFLPETRGLERNEELLSEADLKSTNTGNRGEFHFGNLSPGEYVVKFEKLRIRENEHAQIIASAGTTGLIVHSGDGLVQVQGKVVDGLTGKPIPGCRVSPASPSSRWDRKEGEVSGGNLPTTGTKTRPMDGIFQLEDIPFGWYSFYLVAEGYPTITTLPFDLSLGRKEDLVLKMYPPCKKEFDIVDTTGFPVPMAAVDIEGEWGDLPSRDLVFFIPRAGSGLFGHGELEGIPDGRTTLWVYPPGMSRPYKIPLEDIYFDGDEYQIELPADFTSSRKEIPLLLLQHGTGIHPGKETFGYRGDCEIIARNRKGIRVADWGIHVKPKIIVIDTGYGFFAQRSFWNKTDQPVVPFQLPKGTFTIQVSAQGFHPVEFTLDMGEKNIVDPIPIIFRPDRSQ